MSIELWNWRYRKASSELARRLRRVQFRLAGSPGLEDFSAFQKSLATGDIDSARRSLDAAVSAAPSWPDHRFARVELARYGLIDADRVKDDLEALRHHSQRWVRLRAATELANFLWEREGATREAVAAARSALCHYEISPRTCLRMLALLCASGRTLEAVDGAERLARRQPDFVEGIGYFELARVLARDSRLTIRHADRIERIAERLDADAGRFERVVREAGPDDIAVVGNGPSEVGRGNGRRIDARRLVIKFNNFYEGHKACEDYGSRTDVWFRPGFDEEVHDRPLGGIGQVIVIGSDPRHRYSEGIALFARWAERTIPVEVVPFSIYKKLYSILGASPSSGIAGLFWVSRILGNLPEGSVFGYAPHLNTEFKAVYADHEVKVKTPGRHNWKAEDLLLASITKRENIE